MASSSFCMQIDLRRNKVLFRGRLFHVSCGSEFHARASCPEAPPFPNFLHTKTRPLERRQRLLPVRATGSCSLLSLLTVTDCCLIEPLAVCSAGIFSILNVPLWAWRSANHKQVHKWLSTSLLACLLYKTCAHTFEGLFTLRMMTMKINRD